ncbi:hypothetical protein [Delftia sp.]|uniref:hypothetical protein n=1 Tax=Delftia sp. TaxID=1886637 RepID=UPI00259C7A07|nr:hypothetical protein [Delftia sp.]
MSVLLAAKSTGRRLRTASLQQWDQHKPRPHMVQRAMQALEKALPPQWLQPMKLLGLGDWQRARNTPTASPSGLPATTRWPPLTTLPAATAVRPNGIWTTTRSARWPGA